MQAVDVQGGQRRRSEMRVQEPADDRRDDPEHDVEEKTFARFVNDPAAEEAGDETEYKPGNDRHAWFLCGSGEARLEARPPPSAGLGAVIGLTPGRREGSHLVGGNRPCRRHELPSRVGERLHVASSSSIISPIACMGTPGWTMADAAVTGRTHDGTGTVSGSMRCAAS